MKHSKTVSHTGAKSQARSRARKPEPKTPSESLGLASPGIADSLARHGKIARLPRKIREQLNRHLDEGYGGPQLLRWLNGLPETRRMLKEHFNGQPISQQNLSQWRQGGYRQWLLQQEASEALSEFATGTHDVEQKMGLELADKLALWLCMRYAVMTRQLECMDPLESFKSMRQMCRDVVALRRGDFKLWEQKLKEARQYELTEEDHRKWASHPGRLEQLLYEKTQNQKYLKQIKKEKDRQLDIILGITPKEDEDEEEVAEAESPGSPPAPAAGGVQTDNSSPVQSGDSATPEPPSANTKTKCHKVKQTKTKCVSEAAPGPAPAADASEIKGPPSQEGFASPNPLQTNGPTTALSNGPLATPGNVPENKPGSGMAISAGSETAAHGANITAAAPASAAPGPAAPAPVNPQEPARIPTRPKSYATRCHCGANGTMSAEECPRCHLRWSKNLPCCPCHQAVPGA